MPPNCLIFKRIACALLSLVPATALAGGSDWMGSIDGVTPISRISIPGTHNSGALHEPVINVAKTQNFSITDQLNFGVRFLDIRCRHINDSFAIHHGQIYQEKFFGDILTEVYAFLNAHPDECVMMSVKPEHTETEVTRTFAQTFAWYVSLNPGKWWLGTSTPKLSDVRGRIILVRRFQGAGDGINATVWGNDTTSQANNIRIQDNYVVTNNDAKWNHITTGFTAAITDTNPAVFHFNFTSGYYPGIFGIPNIPTVSGNINPRVKTYFSTASTAPHGCVIMDFATEELCRLVYTANSFTPGPPPEGQYRLVASHSGKVLEVPGATTTQGTRVKQWTWNGGNHQRWQVTHVGNNQYTLTAVHSGLALEVAGSSTSAGGEINQWPYTGANKQKWSLHANDDSSYRITNVNSGLPLEVVGSSTADGAAVQQWTWSALANQRWNFVPAPADGAADPDADGLSNDEEADYGTHPYLADSDGDHFSDGYEAARFSSPTNAMSKPVSLLAACWDFNDTATTGYARDHIGGNQGAIGGGAAYTVNAGGRSGLSGDAAMDFGTTDSGQLVTVSDVGFLNQATADDYLTISFWQKLNNLTEASAFYALSPSAGTAQRGIQVHSPWTDNRIYFDMGGSGGGQRIDVTTTSETWTNWNHFALVKRGATAEIWLNGTLLRSLGGIQALKTDMTSLLFGGEGSFNRGIHGKLDDFAVFNTALSVSQITALASGAPPLDVGDQVDADMDDLNDYWEKTHYGSVTSITPGADTDGDGYTAFEEMVFGMNPNKKDYGNTPQQGRIIDVNGTSMFEYKFRRPKNHSRLSVRYIMQASQTLQASGWSDSLPSPTVAPDGEYEWVTYILPVLSASQGKMFYRCEVIPQ